MPNIRFYYDNKFDLLEAADITVSSAVATLPKTNLLDPFRTKAWRTTGLTTQYFSFDFGQVENCNYLALINHNLTAAGEINVIASDSATFTPAILDETYEAWEPIFGFGEGGFGEYGFGGYIPDAQRDELAAGPIRLIHFDSTVVARYWKVAFTDAANPDSYFELGRPFIGMYWEPERQFKFGYRIVPMDESNIDYSHGGQAWADQMPKRYKAIFDIDVVDLELYWKAIDMLRRWGKRKDILVSMFPEGNPSAKFFTTLYGRFVRIPEIEGADVNKNPMRAEFQESL